MPEAARATAALGGMPPALLAAISSPQALQWLAWLVLGIGLGWLAHRAWRRTPSPPAAWREDGQASLPASIKPLEEPAPVPSPVWRRYGLDMLDPQQIDPAMAAASGPDWQGCIDRLQALRGGWRAAQGARAARAARLLWLDAVLALLDRGVLRPLHDGRLPDALELRTERLLLEADQGPGVLAEVPMLFARRIGFALEAMPEDLRADALARWRLFSELHALAAQERRLERQSQVILALAWNDHTDLDQVEVGYALAQDYDAEMAQWLQRAAGVALVGGARLDGFLLRRCDAPARMPGADAIARVEALRPLHVAMASLLHDTLAELVMRADQVERIRPLVFPRADQDSAT